LQVRLRVWLIGAAGFALGGLLPVNTFAGDASRFAATFLGLFAASVLPTVTLLLTNMVAGARSVKTIQELQAELLSSVDMLFLMLGFIGVAVVALLTLAIPAPQIASQLVSGDVILNRIGQGLVVASVLLVLQTSAAIPHSIRRSLNLKAELALEEARRATRENAPKPGTTAKAFANPEGFGRVVALSELQERGD
jgi:hypothetical protein